MSNRGYETPDLNWGRWLLWGLIAIVALAAVVLFFVMGGENTESTPASTLIPQSGEQAEWSIQVSEYIPSPGLVTLKGDLPTGFPTETWKDDFLITRSTGDSFTWNTSVSPELPTAVYDIDQIVATNQGDQSAICAGLTASLADWGAQVADAQGEAERTWTSAFAQHALNTALENDCQVDS